MRRVEDARLVEQREGVRAGGEAQVARAGEVCDDGNTQNADTCSSNCRVNACGRFKLHLDYWYGSFPLIIRDARGQAVRTLT